MRGLKTKRITISTVPSFDASKIRSIRNKLRFTQSLFAAVMGVSTRTVEAWESGCNAPQGSGQRILWLPEKDDKLLKKYGIIGG